MQDLLAPASVEFYSGNGKRLRSKISLEQEIHDITSIPIEALRGQSLSEFSFEERVSWAARRTTSIKEDKVYCLLGILGVFLPLIYGEGENHAFERLVDEYKRRIVSASYTPPQAQQYFRPLKEFGFRTLVLDPAEMGSVIKGFIHEHDLRRTSRVQRLELCLGR